MSDLKPCPFCGGPVNYFDDDKYIEHPDGNCTLEGSVHESDKWRTRPAEDALRERIKVLEAVLTEVSHPA